MPAHSENWVSRKDYYVLLLVYVLFPLVVVAGGLGISAIVAASGFLALIGLKPALITELPKRFPLALWLVLLLLVWGIVSAIWSPYRSDNILNNPTKLLIGVPVFFGCAAVIKKHAKSGSDILMRILISGFFLAGIAITIDFLAKYALTLAIVPLETGEDPIRRAGDILQNLGHGVTVLALLMSPIAIWFWARGKRLLAVASIVLVFVCGYVSGLSSAVLASIIGLVFVGIAIARPYFAVWLSFIFAVCTLLFAPVLAFTASKMGPEMKASLPFSWEERVETWGYMFHKVLEHPFIGHGFDAVRTFSDKHTIRGFEGRALVSLHPHNAGLHLWAELGLVGVGIACAALFFGAKHLTGEGRLSKPQLIAVSGFVAAATIMANVSYGVWQDWWWAAIIFCSAQIVFIRNSQPSS